MTWTAAAIFLLELSPSMNSQYLPGFISLFASK
uniref:Uncharacterized protein n=1 Tax=Arundo donax TaxID=35708 RepID=A0A0A9CST5_ARUDO